MSVSSKNEREMEFFKSLLEQTSERSDNFAYNKERGLLLFERGVNANRNKTVPASLGNSKAARDLALIGAEFGTPPFVLPYLC